MSRFRLSLAYDGTDYVGWQRQASGVSIQGLLEGALSEIEEGPVTVTGAGRTDAGVHAFGQVAAFSLTRPIATDALVRALNVRLPNAVRALAVEEATADFHPQFAARSKTYRYRIWTGDVVSPFEHRYVWHVPGALDVAAMDAAARSLEGRHDFAAFQSVGSDPARTERTVFSSLVLRPVESVITYEITGDGFLRHMVRAIVGTLVEIGRGGRRPEWIQDVIASRNRSAAGRTAPAAGLFLVRVEY